MDGSHLAEILIQEGYKVYGLMRRSSTDNTWRIKNILKDIEIVTGDLTDQASLIKAIKVIKPDEVYNLAAQSYVGASWDNAEYTMDVNAIGVLRLLEAIRLTSNPSTRVFQASSSEQFGKVRETPQKETTPFYPRSPYGVSKCSAHQICVNYRESYNMFISTAISFNHTSYRRGLEFVERKISHGVAEIGIGNAWNIKLGNLSPKRDWSWAPEFCKMFWIMLQKDKPDDYVLSSGETHSVEEFVIEAFKCIEIEDWQNYVIQDPKFMRPAEVDYLLGDSTKAQVELGFAPKMKFKDIVSEMVNSDIELLKQ